MEKFSQYRDRGTQIAPFLEISSPRTFAQLPLSITLLCLRLPFFLFLFIAYFGVLQWLPIGSLVRKACLWMILLVSGVWWVDLQVEGVKKGSLSKQSKKLPRAGTVIVSSFTSPIDILYLAAVFDPIFTTSYPNTREIERLSLLPAIIRSLSPPLSQPPPGTKLITLPRLLAENPNRSIALFPECTPTNGRGILRFSPSLDSTPEDTPIFPISIRYTPADVTTPVPGWSTAGKFVWRLLSGGTHCVRVRIAGEIYNQPGGGEKPTYDGIEDEGYGEEVDENGYGSGSGPELKRRAGGVGGEEKEKPQSTLCVKGGEALARIGRVKRLNLGVKEKVEFVQAWMKNKKGGVIQRR
ncbi:hypothetical protein BGX38DRAFT_1249175 [Terfezia claveryi]|nr:hypothetical protein BGX38DRAFT_1249175 [Terfezia claveryi]